MIANQPTVLIVEDDDDLRETMTVILEEAGYAVEGVASGAAALSYLHGANVPGRLLVLLDLVMPKMSGPELVRLWRCDAARPKAPFVFVSADRNVARTGRLLDAAGWLLKPFSLDRLLDTVSRALFGAATRVAA